jgi:CHAD domain-containing protein
MDVAVDCYPARYGYYHKTIKQLTDALGGVRDFDVQRGALTAYRNSRPKEDHPAINLLLRELRSRRELARTDMLAFFSRLDEERFDVRFRGFLAEHSLG